MVRSISGERFSRVSPRLKNGEFTGRKSGRKESPTNRNRVTAARAAERLARKGRAASTRRECGGESLALALGWLRLIAVAHGFLEAANAFAQPFAQLRQFLGTKHQQRDSQNHEQVHRLKQTFKHNSSVCSKPLRGMKVAPAGHKTSFRQVTTRTAHRRCGPISSIQRFSPSCCDPDHESVCVITSPATGYSRLLPTRLGLDLPGRRVLPWNERVIGTEMGAQVLDKAVAIGRIHEGAPLGHLVHFLDPQLFFEALLDEDVGVVTLGAGGGDFLLHGPRRQLGRWGLCPDSSAEDQREEIRATPHGFSPDQWHSINIRW